MIQYNIAIAEFYVKGLCGEPRLCGEIVYVVNGVQS